MASLNAVGQLFVRADSNGRETWYGSWQVGGRRIKRRREIATATAAAISQITRTGLPSTLSRRAAVPSRIVITRSSPPWRGSR